MLLLLSIHVSVCAAHTTGYVNALYWHFCAGISAGSVGHTVISVSLDHTLGNTVKDVLNTERMVIYAGLVFTCRNATLHTSFLASKFVWLSISFSFQALPYITSQAWHTHFISSYFHYSSTDHFCGCAFCFPWMLPEHKEHSSALHYLYSTSVYFLGQPCT